MLEHILCTADALEMYAAAEEKDVMLQDGLWTRFFPAVAHARTANIPAPIQRFEYPLPESVSIPDAYPNQHGFLYQAEAIHRCLAVGLRECPLYGKVELK